jgi:hypothetical protein
VIVWLVSWLKKACSLAHKAGFDDLLFTWLTDLVQWQTFVDADIHDRGRCGQRLPPSAHVDN